MGQLAIHMQKNSVEAVHHTIFQTTSKLIKKQNITAETRKLLKKIKV